MLPFITRTYERIKGIHFYSLGLLRRLYRWILSWAESKYGPWALFILAFAESSFFPIPPDVLLIALGISKTKKAWKYATIATIGSVIGGLFGYLIGFAFFETVGKHIITVLGYQYYFDLVGGYYKQNAFWYILAAAFTPIPYKVFTIAAGVWTISIPIFVVASILGRAGRFFLVATLLYFFGPKIKEFIDKYFNILTFALLLLLILGFLAVKYI